MAARSTTRRYSRLSSCSMQSPGCELDLLPDTWTILSRSAPIPSYITPHERRDSFSSSSRSDEGRNSRDAFTDHQFVDIVCSLVSKDRFEIVHVAHDAGIVHDSIGSEKLPGCA